MNESIKNYTWAAGRISIGFIFIWAFLDKLLGLGFATCRDRSSGEYLGLMCNSSFISGGKVTSGFLSNSAGPFADFFKLIAGNSFVEWIFMVGLLCIGIGLILGISINLSTYSGSLMLSLMWLAELPKSNNPFMDDHIVFIFFLFLINWCDTENKLSIGKWWKSLSIIRKYKILQ